MTIVVLDLIQSFFYLLNKGECPKAPTQKLGWLVAVRALKSRVCMEWMSH